MQILLIEDNKFIRMASQRSLGKAGYTVTTAADGEEGLRLARETHPDIILLDLMLPKLSGLEVLRKLQESAATKRIPVIVVSGLAESNGPKLIREGATRFLRKSESLLQEDSQLLLAAIMEVASALKG